MIYRHSLSVLLGISLIALVGCSHSNPLKQYSRKSVAEDLFTSDVAAEMKLGLAKRKYQAGPYYFECMEGKNNPKTCHTIYGLMLKNLRSKYRGLSIADIQDQKLWSYLKPYYQEDLFNRLPE